MNLWDRSQRLSLCASARAQVCWSLILIVVFELICNEVQLDVRIARVLIIVAVQGRNVVG